MNPRVVTAALCLFGGSAPGVLLLGTSDPDANTTAPGGALAGSGWQYLGAWGSTLGVAVGPNHFVTAKHVGGSVGDSFVFGGGEYTVTGSQDSPTSDLRVWTVSGTLPLHAPLYSGNDEVGKDLVVFGRGPARSDITVVNVDGEEAGWRSGGGSGTLRWGENTVSAIVSRPGLGELLRVNFDRTGGPNEATLGSGDSGGAVFVTEGGIWKLAGINYGSSGPYSETPDGPGFSGAIYDTGGLYAQVGSSWVLVLNQSFDIPGYFEATRISENKEWIESVAVVPEPLGVGLAIGGALILFGICRSRSE
jgi:hypothetical protein